MASASARISVTVCALDGLAASAAAAAAALNASRRGASVVGASMRVACNLARSPCGTVVRGRWPCIACNFAPRVLYDATHAHAEHRMRLRIMIEQPKIDAMLAVRF